jgi:hypothetical protein
MPESGRRAPDWEWDEIVLACDLVAQNGWRQLPAEDPRVIELSRLLQKMSIHPAEVRGDKFRNPNGVGRKTADLATNRPGYPGKPTNGGRRDKEVIERFLLEPDVMHAMAESIRASVAAGEPPDFPRDVGYEGESEMEGRYLLRSAVLAAIAEYDRLGRDEFLARHGFGQPVGTLTAQYPDSLILLENTGILWIDQPRSAPGSRLTVSRPASS